MNLYSRWNCFSFGRHPPVSQLCNKSCQILAEGRVVGRVSVSHRITEESGGECGGGSPAPPWHRWDSEYFHIKSQILCPENMCRFLGNTLHYLRGKVKSIYLPQGCTQLLEWRHFPLERKRQRSSPILLTSGLTEIAGYTKENKSIGTFCTWDFELM